MTLTPGDRQHTPVAIRAWKTPTHVPVRPDLLAILATRIPTLDHPALCARNPEGLPPDSWHDAPPNSGEEKAAIKICERCPNLYPCAEWALNNPEDAPAGIWGGITERQRNAAHKRRTRRDAAA